MTRGLTNKICESTSFNQAINMGWGLIYQNRLALKILLDLDINKARSAVPVRSGYNRML
jgi:hypothetical protein